MAGHARTATGRRLRRVGAAALVAGVATVGIGGTQALLSSQASAESNGLTAGTLSTPATPTTIHPNVSGSGDGNVQLNWTDSLTRAVTFKVQRAPVSSPTNWATINGGGSGQSSGSLCTGSLPGTVSCSYTDNSANSTSAPAYNAQYVYQVVASIGGWSATSVGDMAMSLPPTSGTETYLTPPNLNDVSAASASSVWAVGANCTVDYFNGSSWSVQTVPTSVCASGTALNGVDANGGSPVVVGNGGLAFMCTASCTSSAPTWAVTSTGVTANLTAISAQNSTNMWAVGASCTVLYFNGTSWTNQSPSTSFCPSGTTLNGVANNAGKPWVAGNGGLLLVCTAGPGQSCNNATPAWAKGTSGTTADLLAISEGTDKSIVVVGASGTILTCTGGCGGGGATWAAMTSNTSNTLTAVDDLTASTAVFAAGASGTALECTASCNAASGTWTAQTSNTTNTLNGVVATSASTAWAVGNTGTITTNNPPAWTIQTSNVSPSVPTTYPLASSDLSAVNQPDGTSYTDQGAWPSTALGTSCTSGTNPGLLVQPSPTVPSGYSTITKVVATVIFGANTTPGTGAAFQLLVSGNGGTSWTAYSLSNPGSGGSSVTSSVTITGTIDSVSTLNNMELCFQGSSGSGTALTTTLDLIHVDVN